MTVRVLVADDDPLLRTGVLTVLETGEGIEVVGEAVDGEDAVRQARSVDPDVVVMDVRMPRLDGIQATRQIVEAGLAARVLVLTTFEQDDYVFGALRAGASGFLLKRTPPEQLIEAVRVVAAGDALLMPSVTRRVIEAFMASPPAATLDRQALDALTDREVEVLSLIGHGRSNLEISEDLTIAESTAKSHVKHVLLKLGVRDRAQAVVYAYETGLIRAGTHVSLPREVVDNRGRDDRGRS